MTTPTQKSKFMEPCNHCGLCCRESVCSIGASAGLSAPCPALTADGKCAFIVVERQAGRTYLSDTLGIGEGCCSLDDDTPDDVVREFLLKRSAKMQELGRVFKPLTFIE